MLYDSEEEHTRGSIVNPFSSEQEKIGRGEGSQPGMLAG